jgi:hypothetical protein
LFQPGLSGVRCADALETKSNVMPKNKPAISVRCALRAHSLRWGFPLKLFQFDRRMLTSASEYICQEGWHFSSKGYFSTRWAAKKKPGQRATRADLKKMKWI